MSDKVIKWKAPAVPQHVHQMFVVDRHERLLIMHRSANVRSAKNCWSFPSGMHDIGESSWQSMRRELQEEYDLNAKCCQLAGQYENIAGDGNSPFDGEQYHWVISLYAVAVHDLSAAVNKEPEKHDEMRFIPIHDVLAPGFFNVYQFHSSFHSYFEHKRGKMIDAMNEVIQYYKDHLQPRGGAA